MLFQDKFRYALETSQRVIKDTFMADNIQMNQVLTATSELYSLISSNNSLAKTVQLLEQTYRVVDLITNNITEDDVKYIKDNGDKITKDYFWSWYDVWLGDHAVYYAETMLKIENHNESKILKYFEACEATNETSVILTQELSPAVNKDNDNVSNIETTTESLMSAAINNNITLHDSYCNETSLDNFNTSVWKEFQNLINSNDTSVDYVDQITETWSDLPIFLKIYVGLNWLENLTEERERIKHLFDTNINVTDIFHSICNVTIETTTEPMVVTNVVPTIPQISGNLPTDVINCTTIFDEVNSTYFSISLRIFEFYIPYLESYEKRYLTFIEMIYVNMSEIPEFVPHVKCIDLIKFLANYTVELKHMYYLLRNVTEVENIEEAIPVLKDLYDGYFVWRILNLNFTEYGWKVDRNDYCHWINPVIRDEKAKLAKIIKNLEATTDFKKQGYDYMEHTFNSCGLIKTYITKILPTIEMINSYLERNITKRSLAINFNKPVFIKALNDMVDAAADMESSTKDFRNKVAALRVKVVEGFQELTKFTLPFLNKVNVHELSFIKAVKALRKDSYNKIIDTFYEDLEKGIGDLLRVNYEDFVKYTLTVVDQISNTVDNLTDQVVQLQSDLNDYKATTKMDVDFYM